MRFYLLLALLNSLNSPAPAPHRLEATSAFTLPFELVGGVIVLRNLRCNDQRGDFVLDTGCTYALVVEQAAFARQLRPSATQGLSAAGAIPLHEVNISQLGFGPARPPQTAPALSLAAIRAVVGPRLLGLIGTGLLRHYEVVLDYAHHRLSCYPLDAPAPRPFARRDSVAFTLQKGWPIAVAFIDSVPVQLLLDTGSGDNHLDADFAQNLSAGTRPRKTTRETLLTPGGRVAAQRATLPQLQIGATQWQNTPMVLAPPVHYQSGRALPYQGVLGNVFFRQAALVSFHFGRQQFYSLVPRSTLSPGPSAR
jgi:predicted aspartyl protease